MTRIALVITSVVLLGARTHADEKQAGPSVALTLELDGGWTSSGPNVYWIYVRSSGQVEREGTAPDGPSRLSPEALNALAELMRHERFLNLAKSYGTCAPDMGSRRIIANLDGRRHTVRFCDMNAPGVPVRDVRAFLRVWYGCLRAVSRHGAVRVWDYDKRILEGVR